MDLRDFYERLGPVQDEVPGKYQRREMKNMIPPGADGEAPSKAQDDKEFLAKWIPYGMAMKAKADGYGIPWRGTSFEKWEGAITFADVWNESQEEPE